VSDENPTREGLCVYCGTSRAVAKPICPQCGRTWIDTKVGEQLPPLTPEVVAASVEEREALSTATANLEPSTSHTRRPWGLLVGAALAVLVIAIAFSSLLGGDTDGDTDAVAPPTTASVPDSTTATTNTTAATTTSPATTSSTTTTSTTTTTTTTLAPIEAEGSAVAIQDLTLGAFTFGPFSFGADTPYLGRLVASLGQPDSRRDAGTDLGLCEGEDGVAYTWDGLTAIFRVEGDNEVFVGYRLIATDTDHPSQSITSRSGLEIGHTVATLDAIYLQSGITFEEIDGSLHFLLLRSTDDATLLWGPVTSTESSGVIEGIYSPRACDGGPRATP